MNLHDTDYQIKIKQGTAANINATATVNAAVEGEPHWTTDTDTLFVYDGTLNRPVAGSAPYVAKTANYTLVLSDYAVNCTSGTFTLTLPTAVGCANKMFVMKNSGAGLITIATTSSQTIDGNASGALVLYQYDALTVMSDGANWIIL